MWWQFHSWRRIYLLTILPWKLSGKLEYPQAINLHLHYFTACRHCNTAEFSKHGHLREVWGRSLLCWFHWVERWTINIFTSSGQTLWQGDTCPCPIKPKLFLDEVSAVSCQNYSKQSYIEPRIQNYSRFSSYTSEPGAGFQIKYNSLDLFTMCGGTYSNESGVLASPSHPNAYPDLANCVYLISQPYGKYINISFGNIDISCQGFIKNSGTRERTSITSDYIELRDGNSEDSSLLGRGKFCGNGSNLPHFIQTTQNHLRIRWKKELKRNKYIIHFFNVLLSQILFQLL